MTLIHKIALICCLICFGWNASINAQSAKKDLQRLEALYEGIEDIYIEMVSKTYAAGNLTIQQNAKIYKQGGNYLYRTEQMSMLINKKYILMIDHQTYNIVCNDWTNDKAKALRNQHVPKSKELFEKYPEVVYMGNKNGYRQYSFENLNQMMSKIEIFFNTKTGFADKTIYHRNPSLTKDKIRMEVEFKQIKTNPKLEKSLFSETQFIKITKGKLEGVGAYADYTLHDFRQ